MTMEDGEGNSPNGDGGDRKTAKREKRKSKSSIASSMERREEDRILPLPQQPKEVQVKGVRVCRECRDVVSWVPSRETMRRTREFDKLGSARWWVSFRRKQKIQDRQRVTGFARLYQMLRGLQAEIEEVLPEFEEQLDYLT